jgi:hypothetical protein
MKIKNTTTQVQKTVKAKEYIFELRKCNDGIAHIGNSSFDYPNSDGIAINELMSILSNNAILTVTITIPEEST